MRGVPARWLWYLHGSGALGVTLTAWSWCWRARQRVRRGPQAAGHRSPGPLYAAAAAP